MYLIDITPYDDNYSYTIEPYGKTEVNLKELLALIHGQAFWDDTDDRIWDELYELVGLGSNGKAWDDPDYAWNKILEYADVTEKELEWLLNKSKKLLDLITN